MVWFSQEARSYSLATLLSALTVLCVVGYQRSRRSRWLAGWAASAALGLATHYFVAFVVLGELVWLWRTAPRDRRLAAAVGLVAVVGGALVPLAVTQQQTGHADYISHSSLHTTLVQIPKQLLLGYASPDQKLTAVLAALLLLVGAVAPLALSAPVRARAAWPLATGAVAVLVPVVLAVCGVDFLDTRNLLPALPPLVIAAGIGFAGWAGAGGGEPAPGLADGRHLGGGGAGARLARGGRARRHQLALPARRLARRGARARSGDGRPGAARRPGVGRDPAAGVHARSARVDGAGGGA